MTRETIRKSDHIRCSFTVVHQHRHGLKNKLYQRRRILSAASAAHKTFVVGCRAQLSLSDKGAVFGEEHKKIMSL